MPQSDPLLDLGPLRIEAEPRPSNFDRWFDVVIRVAAHPFGGDLKTIFTDADLNEFAAELEAAETPGRVVLGGGRACEVSLISEWQNGVAGELLAVECSVTPSGDDPFPRITFLAFDVTPFASGVASRVRALTALEPWPRPG